MAKIIDLNTRLTANTNQREAGAAKSVNEMISALEASAERIKEDRPDTLIIVEVYGGEIHDDMVETDETNHLAVSGSLLKLANELTRDDE